MIFKTLFQPKYKHKDPAVRIQALQQLSPDDQQHISILHELAFNDSNVAVSMAALEKLNNFDLWWKMADTSSDQRIVRKARSKVEQALMGAGDVVVTDKIKHTFIKECKDVALLETLLQHGVLDESDTGLMLGVLTKINKPQLNMRILLSTDNAKLRSSLFDQIHDESEIAKIAKKAKTTELVELANNKLAHIQEMRQKPIQLAKDVRLVLSKLLALVEQQDYQALEQQRTLLQQQFDDAKASFDCLDADSAQEFTEKFQGIVQRLDKKALQLQGAWQEQQVLEQQSKVLQQAHDTANQVLSKVKDSLNKNASEITLGELESFTSSIEQAQDSLTAIAQQNISPAERKGIESLINKLLACRASLDSLPALQTALGQADELLNQFSDLSLPNDVSQIDAAQLHLDELEQKWNALKEQFTHIWPTEIDARWKKVRKSWIDSLRSLRAQLNETVNTCRTKLNIVRKQIDQGRFKNAFRHYEKLLELFQDLPETQKAKLGRSFESVQLDIENLKDWQAYIAQPRKPEVLKEIEQLALHPLEPTEQARRVKEIRHQWNSLGTVDSEADELMNKAFDMACEKAFAPCREFFAEQDARREQNLNHKFSLLERLAEMLDAGTAVSELEKAYMEMRKQWQEVGDIDFKSREQLNERYQQVINPVKEKINGFYQQNADLKNSLVEQAKELIGLENWREATDKAKELQGQWRKIEKAGAKAERKLWSEFRAINDQIFAKRDEEFAKQKEEQNVVIEAIQSHLTELSEKVEQAQSRSDLTELKSKGVASIREQFNSLPKGAAKELREQFKDVSNRLSEKLEYLSEYQNTELYRNIFTILEQWRGADAPEAAGELPGFWRQAFQVATIDEGEMAKYNRKELLILMELMRGIESPQEDSEMRKTLQLQLMALKLEQGEHMDMDELLRSWIGKGVMSDDDLQLLPRLNKVFVP